MSVDPDDVERVLGSTELDDADIQSFIDAARRGYLQRTGSESVSADEQDDVVTHLAAHLIAMGPERQISSAGEGGGNVSFEGQTGEGLMATTHGQIAVVLDPTGQLDDDTADPFTLSA